MNFNDLLASNDADKIIAGVKAVKAEFNVTKEEAKSQYHVLEHDVFDTQKRPDKIVKRDSGEKDGEGNIIYVSQPVPVSRVALPVQDLIVERRVGFMLSDPVTTEATFQKDDEKSKSLADMVDKIQADNKMEYRNKEIARRLMSEMEVAELWYLVPTGEADPKYTLKVRIISPELLDSLYPVYDETDDMVAFGRGYKLKENETEVEHFDLFTPDYEYKYILVDKKWILDELSDAEGANIPNPIPNQVKKIMVIYHSQNQPEWTKVQAMISRFEELYSNHADMNDYFGSPILAVAGEILGFAQKGEQGKILQMDENAKANYLALSSPPESIKMEIDNLKESVYTMSQTPNITFEQMKGLNAFSGIAMKLMFMDCHMAVRNKEEIFGIGLQRRLNLIKATIATVIVPSLAQIAKTVQLRPVIHPYLPENMTELIENLSVAYTGGIMSRETAVEQNPLVADPTAEMDRMKQDATSQLSGQ